MDRISALSADSSTLKRFGFHNNRFLIAEAIRNDIINWKLVGTSKLVPFPVPFGTAKPCPGTALHKSRFLIAKAIRNDIVKMFSGTAKPCLDTSASQQQIPHR